MFHYQFNYLNRSILNVLKKRTYVPNVLMYQNVPTNVLKPVLYRICTNFFRFHAPFFSKNNEYDTLDIGPVTLVAAHNRYRL